MKAEAVYISIYSKAKKSIHYVDDYLGAKTLHDAITNMLGNPALTLR